jgi:hypothetical protein
MCMGQFQEIFAVDGRVWPRAGTSSKANTMMPSGRSKFFMLDVIDVCKIINDIGLEENFL